MTDLQIQFPQRCQHEFALGDAGVGEREPVVVILLPVVVEDVQVDGAGVIDGGTILRNGALLCAAETTFYAHVEGDSMRDAGILDGDIVVVDRSLDPKNGDFIIAYIDNEYTLKEFRMDESGQCAWLIPHNPDFQPIRVSAESNFMVWGVVTYAIHRLN